MARKKKTSKTPVAPPQSDGGEERDVINISALAIAAAESGALFSDEEQNEPTLEDAVEFSMASETDAFDDDIGLSGLEIEETEGSEEEPEDEIAELDDAVSALATDKSDEVLETSEIQGYGELAEFTSAEADETLQLEPVQVKAIIESLLFASDRPVSMDLIRQAFKGTNIKTPQIRQALEEYRIELSHPSRGVSLDEVASGFQIRTKTENVDFLRRSVKNRVFKLSGPALEVLSIVAYKQPCVKAAIDEIRGVESGHLLRALMDRALIRFAGKSDLPGRPMFYETTRKFLEIFGLRNIKELPTPSEIDELIPEGIGETVIEDRNLGALTSTLSLESGETYSEGETELLKISDELSNIKTTTDFFEQEQARQKAQRERERAEDIREAIVMGSVVDTKDLRWLERYEKQQALASIGGGEAIEAAEATGAAAAPEAAPGGETPNETETPVDSEPEATH